MTLWKKSLPKQGKSEPEPRPSRYLQLKKEIPLVRKQGELPARVQGSFSKYFCDLCNTTFTIAELRQCSICGRWACHDCWTPEYYLCNSCFGILRLHEKKD